MQYNRKEDSLTKKKSKTIFKEKVKRQPQSPLSLVALSTLMCCQFFLSVDLSLWRFHNPFTCLRFCIALLLILFFLPLFSRFNSLFVFYNLLFSVSHFFSASLALTLSFPLCLSVLSFFSLYSSCIYFSFTHTLSLSPSLSVSHFLTHTLYFSLLCRIHLARFSRDLRSFSERDRRGAPTVRSFLRRVLQRRSSPRLVIEGSAKTRHEK